MLFIKNANAIMPDGKMVANTEILIENGKIADIGTNLKVSTDIKVIDVEGKIVSPGLIDAHSHIGLAEEGIGALGRDYNEMSNPITPEMRGIDGIYQDDLGFELARQAGVTTVVTGPGSANAIGGMFSAIKTIGRRVDDMIVKKEVALKVAFGENIKRVYGTKDKAPISRMGIMALQREFFYKAIDYKNRKNSDNKPEFNLQYEAVLPVLNKEIPIKAHTHRTDDIFSAIRLAKEFDFDLTLDHCTEGALIADILAEEGYSAIIGPTIGSASKYELRNQTFATPAKLYEKGIKFAIMTDNDFVPTMHLALCVGLAIRSGLPIEEGWKSVTSNAAEITGIADRVGSLEKGKDADLVVWTDNPLTMISAEVDRTIIDGITVYELGVDEKKRF